MSDSKQGKSEKKGMILPFQPLTMTFHNVNYYVDMPKEMRSQGVPETRLQLLSNVSGVFSPGVLTALVGSSGAGKTTLMDVLAGRKTGGYIEGDIRISGHPKEQRTFARISGYVEQNDIHSPQVTVEESLWFSASLRLPKEISKEKKKEFVEEVMRLVELDTLRYALVGLPGTTGLSTEQRKRLTIAVELVANPSIIFMDEPTSGLDARAAAIVMRTVRNTVDTGRTVVCTIHQPSIDIFEAFDENDIHSPQVTVEESLWFSASLRLPKEISKEQKKEFVEEVMRLVELDTLRYALVGLPGTTGLSTEQRKRLTIAVELVANPSIIFMDEPTSGLDARAAAIVMRTVRNTVDTGRTVVCTIHQPSIDIFEAFDELLLMKRGGQVIYGGKLGKHSQVLVDYFQGINGVPAISSGYNPATWMLEVTTPALEEKYNMDFADLYKNSDQFR
ncbi:PREDICTED: ABC transporter G family member 31-like [Camelina sativa]|uniref:ABC transporter G family member 31-like n=1 Tax=Camelina sativa TaxID=90675 RepID=A0ABM1RP82_CAMSA|nr:PREDICTED: ABC transporter G family member 31-like [Camelina sativa]